MPQEHALRFNDVIADPMGRVFCGTFCGTFSTDQPGRLYRLDLDGSIVQLLDGIGCSNGMAFTLDRTDSFIPIPSHVQFIDSTTTKLTEQFETRDPSMWSPKAKACQTAARWIQKGIYGLLNGMVLAWFD